MVYRKEDFRNKKGVVRAYFSPFFLSFLNPNLLSARLSETVRIPFLLFTILVPTVRSFSVRTVAAAIRS
jgi:hypothetical protein